MLHLKGGYHLVGKEYRTWETELDEFVFRETWSEKEFLGQLSDISKVGKLRKHKYLLWRLPLHHRSILNLLCLKHQADRFVAVIPGWVTQSQNRYPTDCGQHFLLSKENTEVFPPVLSKSLPETCPRSFFLSTSQVFPAWESNTQLAVCHHEKDMKSDCWNSAFAGLVDKKTLWGNCYGKGLQTGALKWNSSSRTFPRVLISCFPNSE